MTNHRNEIRLCRFKSLTGTLDFDFRMTTSFTGNDCRTQPEKIVKNIFHLRGNPIQHITGRLLSRKYFLSTL